MAPPFQFPLRKGGKLQFIFYDKEYKIDKHKKWNNKSMNLEIGEMKANW